MGSVVTATQGQRNGACMGRSQSGDLKTDGRWDSDEMAVHYARTNLKEFGAVYRYHRNLEESRREARRASVSKADDSHAREPSNWTFRADQ